MLEPYIGAHFHAMPAAKPGEGVHDLGDRRGEAGIPIGRRAKLLEAGDVISGKCVRKGGRWDIRNAGRFRCGTPGAEGLPIEAAPRVAKAKLVDLVGR